MGIKMVKLRAVLAGAGLVLGLAILSMASPAAAQNATVVSACGTPPATYPVGANRAVTQDTNGNTCTNTTSGGGVAPAPYKPTIVPLDVATVTTGTPATVLNANHRPAGGFLITSNAAGFCVSENGTAGTTTATVAGVATVCVAANQRYTLLPSANAVSVTSPGTGVAISGYGQQ